MSDAAPLRHEPESENGSHYVCGRCGEHLTDEQIGESQDEALTPCEVRPVAWRSASPGEAAPLRLPTRAAVAEAFGEERARGVERVLGPIEGPAQPYTLPVATAVLPSGHRLACVGRTEEEAESMRAAAESQGQAEGEATRERAGTMWIRGESFPLYRDDTPEDVAQRIGGTVDASGAVVPVRPADIMTTIDEQRRRVSVRFSPLPPAAEAEVVQSALDEALARRGLAPRPPVIRATNATLFIGGKSYGTLKDVTITEKRPTASRAYNTRGHISMTFTATVNSPALAKMAEQLAPPASRLRRLGWREKRRARGAKRRTRQ